MTNDKKTSLTDELINVLIEYNGLDWMIEFLLEAGYSYNELIDMQFDGDYIKSVASDIGKVL